jgi:hypothetical protein
VKERAKRQPRSWAARRAGPSATRGHGSHTSSASRSGVVIASRGEAEGP